MAPKEVATCNIAQLWALLNTGCLSGMKQNEPKWHQNVLKWTGTVQCTKYKREWHWSESFRSLPFCSVVFHFNIFPEHSGLFWLISVPFWFMPVYFGIFYSGVLVTPITLLFPDLLLTRTTVKVGEWPSHFEWNAAAENPSFEALYSNCHSCCSFPNQTFSIFWNLRQSLDKRLVLWNSLCEALGLRRGSSAFLKWLGTAAKRYLKTNH